MAHLQNGDDNTDFVSTSFFLKIPKSLKRQFSDARLESNVVRMYFFSIYIVFLQIALNVINMLRPSDGKGSDIMIYIILSLSLLTIGFVYFFLFLFVRKGFIKNRFFKIFLVESIVYLYLIIQLTFCTLNIYSTGGVNSYIIAILIIGMVPIISPFQSAASILLSFGYVILAMYSTRHSTGMWNSILITDTWANLIIITGLTICVSVFMYQMYVSNFMKSVKLERYNAELENIVTERTVELEKQTHAAQIASKAKSDFLARMSHEIRTPLNAIIGMTQIAKKTESLDKKNYSIDEIMTASLHLLDLLNDVLDMTKIESGKFILSNESFLLMSAGSEVEKLIKPRCMEKNINLKVDYSGIEDVFVNGDKMRLKQVLINLLGNAVKFTDVGGEVIFSVCATSINGKISVLFSVKDTGIGMTTEQVDKLFNVFEQTDETVAIRFGGTGLGLAISQNIVEKMGGVISVESEKGVGSSFFFTLEMEISKKNEEVNDSVSEKIDFSGKRILLVEDVEINRIILVELLKDTNIHIDEAGDGKSAVELFSSSPLNFYDLIFMDIQMPVMGGYEATQKIREMNRSDSSTVPIIALTANAYKDDIEKAIHAGMNGHLSKPVDIDEVINMLKEKMFKNFE